MSQPVIETLFPSFSLVPVVVIHDAEDALPLAEALLAGGIGCIEITLRTDAALRGIEQVSARLPEMLVGAGTVCDYQQMHDAQQAGAVFQVSPGISDALAQQAQSQQIAWLPGISSASDIIVALAHDYHYLKFFPASLAGGVPMLKQLSGVFGNCRFCPTGGIDQDNMNDYAALPSVFAIGGSWLTPKAAIENKQWAVVTQCAKESLTKLVS